MNATARRNIAEATNSSHEVNVAVESGQLGTDVGSRLAGASRYAFSVLTGMHEVLWDEMMFVNKEFVERIAVESTLFNELLARLAEAHSARDYGTAYRDCTQHQIEFLRRDMERVLKHGERAVDNAAKLAQTWMDNAAFAADAREQA